MSKFVPWISVVALVAVGCANTAGNTDVACSALSAQTTKPTADWQGSVFTIVMENHGKGDIVGNKDAPFINSLIQQNALAGGYHDSYVHPSEPNYFEMVAGQNFGVLDDDSPSDHHLSSKSHLVDQIELQGMTWRSYQESMGDPCGVTSKYPYEPKHDPFVFFDDVNGWDGKAYHPEQRCNAHVVDYSQFDGDLASGNVPKYVFITPNMINDMHDGSVKDGDTWLSHEVPKILASDAFNKGGVLFLTWDEGSGWPQADDPPMIVISPHAKRGFVSNTDYNASSYLETVQKIMGLEVLPCNPKGETVQSMDDLFDVPLSDTAATGTTTGTTTTGTTTGTTPTGTSGTTTGSSAADATPPTRLTPMNIPTTGTTGATTTANTTASTANTTTATANTTSLTTNTTASTATAAP